MNLNWSDGKFGLYKTINVFQWGSLCINLLSLDNWNYILMHKDKYEGNFKHYQLLICYNKKGVGAMYLGECIFNLWDMIVLYNPKEQQHGIARIEGGHAKFLTIGWRI